MKQIRLKIIIADVCPSSFKASHLTHYNCHQSLWVSIFFSIRKCDVEMEKIKQLNVVRIMTEEKFIWDEKKLCVYLLFIRQQNIMFYFNRIDILNKVEFDSTEFINIRS